MKIHAFAAAAALAAAAGFTIPALAQMSHAHAAMTTTAASAQQRADGAGEVRKIDVQNRKVTLKHEAMQDMGMPAMTMVYPVADASVLSKIKVGDKVRFRAASAGGKTTITEMQAVQ